MHMYLNETDTKKWFVIWEKTLVSCKPLLAYKDGGSFVDRRDSREDVERGEAGAGDKADCLWQDLEQARNWGSWQLMTENSDVPWRCFIPCCCAAYIASFFTFPWKFWQNLHFSLLLCEGRFTLKGDVHRLTFGQAQDTRVLEGPALLGDLYERKCTLSIKQSLALG